MPATNLAHAIVQPSALGFVPPMLATPVAAPPEGAGWLHEISYDGFRTQLVIDGRGVRAFTRSGHNHTHRYRPIAAAAAHLDCAGAVLDGEVIVEDAEGRPDFPALQAAIEHRPERLVFYAFDLLASYGSDLRSQPLIERRARLCELIGDIGDVWPIRFSEHVVGNGSGMFAAAEQLGLEGIVSKRVDSRYVSSRSANWLKARCGGARPRH